MAGITVPSSYIGCSFSTFQLHIESGHLASVSYLLRGGAKIWYIIAAKDASLLEYAINTEFKERSQYCGRVHSHNM